MDLDARNARKVENLPPAIVEDVLAKLSTILS
jgi:hypothetical protein